MLLRENGWKMAVPIAALLCLWGGIYDLAVAVYGLVFACGLLFLLKTKKKICIPFNITTCGMAVIFLGTLVAVFPSADRGMALIGVMRMAVPALFWILWCNLEEPAQEQIRMSLPCILAVLTGAAFMLYLVPAARPYLYRADRLGGVFQYSNTYALLLLAVLLLLLCGREEWGKKDYLTAGILICGIVFCGSRSVMVLAIVFMAVCMVCRKREWRSWNWRRILPFLILVIAALVLMQMIFRLDVGRLGELTLSSSTLNGRFLYWQDAVPQIFSHPLGLGYMSYYYLQPQFQTGKYVVRFVHNDILQMGLDAGILPMLALTVIFAAGIFGKKSPLSNRIALAVIGAHCLFDLDLQYISVFCIALMCMRTESEREHILNGRGALAGAGVLVIFYLYFATAMGLSQAGMDREALALYPGYTDSALALMEETQDAETAEKLISKNRMLASAYDCAADEHAGKGEYEETYEDVEGMLRCAGYDMYYYDQSVYYLSFALNAAIEADDIDAGQKILEKIQEIPRILERLEERTSRLAWRINDKPEFELEESVSTYLDSLSGVSLK